MLNDGARYPITGVPLMSSSACRLRVRSSRNSCSVSCMGRTWPWPWHATSWPRATISRTSSGSRSATQPRTKKVARTPCDSRRSSTTRVPSPARRGRSSHEARGNTARRFSTWNHSSMSMGAWRSSRASARLYDLLGDLPVVELGGLRTPSEHHGLHRVEDDAQIEERRHAFDVEEVVPHLLDLFVEAVGVAVADLRPAGGAGT